MRKKHDKIAKVMSEWHAGKLHSGSDTGPMVTSKAQAVAIALSEQRRKSHMAKKRPAKRPARPRPTY